MDKTTLLVIFCADPMRARQPDPAYADEVYAAADLGLPRALLDYEAQIDGADPARALRQIEVQPDWTLGLYRGWMMTPSQYTHLFTALLDRRIRLINDPDAYRHCHYLPASFEVIAERTPASVWLAGGPEVDMDQIMDLLRPFDARPVIVKDYVKSRKQEWHEACFIPQASDRNSVERVVRRFLALQGPDLAGGLVFREYVDLDQIGTHGGSGMPLAREYRIFYLDGEPLTSSPYWDEGDYGGAVPPLDAFTPIARAVRSRFFTMDVARRCDGEWIIVELGDGQVAGLPEAVDVRTFYSSLSRCALTLPPRPASD